MPGIVRGAAKGNALAAGVLRRTRAAVRERGLPGQCAGPFRSSGRVAHLLVRNVRPLPRLRRLQRGAVRDHRLEVAPLARGAPVEGHAGRFQVALRRARLHRRRRAHVVGAARKPLALDEAGLPGIVRGAAKGNALAAGASVRAGRGCGRDLRHEP